jgi:hypothetical protein
MKSLASDISSAFITSFQLLLLPFVKEKNKGIPPISEKQTKKLRYRYMSSNRNAARRQNYEKNNPRVKKNLWF